MANIGDRPLGGAKCSASSRFPLTHVQIYGAEALKHCLAATEVDPSWSRAWSTLALAHSSIASATAHERPPDIISKHIIPAMAAYYKAVGRASDDGPYVLQDTLRLVDLLFSYGHEAQVAEAWVVQLSGHSSS